MYSPLSGITHETLINTPLFCRITKGDLTEFTCMYLFHTSINIQIQLYNIPNYFKAEVILEEGYNMSSLGIVELDEHDTSINMQGIMISGGWYRRTFNLYIKVHGLSTLMHIKKFYCDTTSSISFPSKSYLLSISNALSNSDITIWKRALSHHLSIDDNDTILNRSAIHTIMVIYALNFKQSSSTDIQSILINIMDILGKKISKEVLYITIKRIVNFKYHSERLLYDILYEMEDYINSNLYHNSKFLQLMLRVKELKV